MQEAASNRARAITACPHCAARFHVRAEQVRSHGGLVRCGACRGIFDAIACLVKGELDLPEHDRALDPAQAGPKTIIQGHGDAAHGKSLPGPDEAHSTAQHTEPSQAPAGGAASQRRIEPSLGPFRSFDYESWRRAGSASDHGEDRADLREASREYRWRKPPRPLSRSARIAWGVLGVGLLLLLIAQLIYGFRDWLAARFPAAKPALVQVCAYLGCEVAAPRSLSALGIVGADLVADPAHKGLFVFTATLRNDSAWPVALPHLILTLEDAGARPLARKVIAPAQYVPAHVSVEQGLAGHADLEVKLYLDASQVNAVNFKVDQAYL
ncbi:MAG: zinc-ribbon domain-containing protein [Casimicrobiaceae bacterium]|nr:zinc-ribbon domain-containing protein [Casimicrobiaceae bacterium]